MKAVNPANIGTGNGYLEENGLYALLISRQEEIIGLVKPLLPKSTMKSRVIHITVIPLGQAKLIYSLSSRLFLKCMRAGGHFSLLALALFM